MCVTSVYLPDTLRIHDALLPTISMFTCSLQKATLLVIYVGYISLSAHE
jgi:hypothetical protein